MKRRLEGKVAIVTGATGGIGSAVKEALTTDGARVLDARRLQVDLRREESVAAYVADMITTAGHLGILVTCAAAPAKIGSALDPAAIEAWDALWAVDVRGVERMCRHVGRHMAARGSGAIVNLTSIHSQATYPGRAPYAAAKGAVAAYSRALALEVAPRGVRVNCVAPGPVATPRLEGVFGREPGSRERMLARTPMGRFGRPEDVARVVAWLCSEDAQHVTGQEIVVDGGLLASAWYGDYPMCEPAGGRVGDGGLLTGGEPPPSIARMPRAVR